VQPLTAKQFCISPTRAISVQSISPSFTIRKSASGGIGLREVSLISAHTFSTTCIDTCAWPLPESTTSSRARRPVGLGIMALPTSLFEPESYIRHARVNRLMEEMMGFIRRESWNASINSVREGVFRI